MPRGDWMGTCALDVLDTNLVMLTETRYFGANYRKLYDGCQFRTKVLDEVARMLSLR